MHSQTTKPSRKRKQRLLADIFVSYSSPDLATAKYFAKWINDAGLKPHIIIPGEGGGKSFPSAMNDALSGCDRLLAVCTSSYLKSKACLAEIDAMWIRDPDGTLGRIIVAKLDGSELPPLLATRDYWNFTTSGEQVQHEFIRRIKALKPIKRKRSKKAKLNPPFASGDETHPKGQSRTPSLHAAVIGSNNTIKQAGRDIHEHHYSETPKVTNVLERRGDELTSEQAHEIGHKLAEWGDLIWETSKDKTIQTRKKAHEEARSRFRKKFRIPRYDALDSLRYENGLNHIQKEIAKLRPKLLRKDKTKGRQAYIGSIKQAMRLLGTSNGEYYPQLAARLKMPMFEHLTDLSDKNLKRVYGRARSDALKHSRNSGVRAAPG